MNNVRSSFQHAGNPGSYFGGGGGSRSSGGGGGGSGSLRSGADVAEEEELDFHEAEALGNALVLVGSQLARSHALLDQMDPLQVILLS